MTVLPECGMMSFNAWRRTASTFLFPRLLQNRGASIPAAKTSGLPERPEKTHGFLCLAHRFRGITCETGLDPLQLATCGVADAPTKVVFAAGVKSQDEIFGLWHLHILSPGNCWWYRRLCRTGDFKPRGCLTSTRSQCLWYKGLRTANRDSWARRGFCAIPP